jgi:hypothetical protein
MRARSVLAAVSLFSASALAKAEDRSVPEFDSVHVCCGMRATIAIGPRQPVHLEGDEESLAAVETIVESGELTIRFRPGRRESGSHEVRVSIQTPALRGVSGSGGSIIDAAFTRGSDSEIQASGGSEIQVRGVDAARLSIQASGGSILTVAGSADVLHLQLSGGSQLHGKDLTVKDLDIQGSGGSQANLRASGKIRGGLSGGSELHARGGASTRVSTSGGSSVDVEN